jgi:hypothetical protein
VYAVYLKKSAEKELENLPAKIHDKIITVILSPAMPKSFMAAKVSE